MSVRNNAPSSDVECVPCLVEPGRGSGANETWRSHVSMSEGDNAIGRCVPPGNLTPISAARFANPCF